MQAIMQAKSPDSAESGPLEVAPLICRDFFQSAWLIPFSDVGFKAGLYISALYGGGWFWCRKRAL